MQLEQINLTQVYISDKNKNKQPLITKNGKAYKKIAIKCKEHGDEYLTAFIWDENSELLGWATGQQHDIIWEKNGQWINFKVPSRLDRLEMRVKILEDFMAKEPQTEQVPIIQEGEEEINPEDLPF